MRWAAISFALVALVPATAAAHLGLMYPRSRYGRNIQKEGPCGMTGGVRSANVSEFRPGETIQIVFDEFIDHPGHYRVAFDRDGDDDFVDPPCLARCDTSDPVIELNSDPTVLLDGIADRNARAGDDVYTLSVTLPNVTCDNCTLQVIQVMYDKPPQTRPGNDLYYQCADLVLTGEPMPGADPPPDTGPGPGPAPGPAPGPGPTYGDDAGAFGGPPPGATPSDPGRPGVVVGTCTVSSVPGGSSAPLAVLVVVLTSVMRRRKPRALRT